MYSNCIKQVRISKSSLVNHKIWLYVCLVFFIINQQVIAQENYLNYHRDMINVEKLITQKDYANALAELEILFSDYEFVFLRDIKVASQLALLKGDEQRSIEFIQFGISRGWDMSDIKKTKYLKPVLDSPKWKAVTPQYDSLRSQYLERLNDSLRAQVKVMHKKDQKKALGALFRIGNKAQENYGVKKFAPHSELQMQELRNILITTGYPGEKIIGNDFWMSTIVSHHNSCSYEYVIQDTIYPSLKPNLLEAIKRGELSPFEYAIMEDWKSAVESSHNSTTYGILGKIQSQKDLDQVDQNRALIGMRPVALRNALIDLEDATGLDFYLTGNPWQDGKITINEEN